MKKEINYLLFITFLTVFVKMKGFSFFVKLFVLVCKNKFNSTFNPSYFVGNL